MNIVKSNVPKGYIILSTDDLFDTLVKELPLMEAWLNFEQRNAGFADSARSQALAHAKKDNDGWFHVNETTKVRKLMYVDPIAPGAKVTETREHIGQRLIGYKEYLLQVLPLFLRKYVGKQMNQTPVTTISHGPLLRACSNEEFLYEMERRLGEVSKEETA